MDLTFRRGTEADNEAVFQVQMMALADLARRHGMEDNAWESPGFRESYWKRHQPLYRFLARSADQFWVAEQEGKVIGHARSVLEDGVQQLTEFFVSPACQAAGIGRELLSRAFPERGARTRTIIASPDIRALVRYLKSGVAPRFSAGFLYRTPEAVTVATEARFVRAEATAETLAQMRSIDGEILGFHRDAQHEFLLADRQALLVTRKDRIVGYGYTGKATGPIALLDGGDFPALLAHMEGLAAERGDSLFGAVVPLINRAAVAYLLGRGFRLAEFLVSFMSDRPVNGLENYIFASPPFFL